jgi:dihydrofolate reductase
MRKVILGFGMTLDGYIARPDHSFDYLVLDKDSEKVMTKFFATIDTTIMGRKTAAVTAKMQAKADMPEMPEMPGIRNYVFSRRWKPGERKGFTVVNEPLPAFVRKLRKRPGKHIYLGGGGELARSFLKDDLVDELFLGIVPILLGAGIPAFPSGFPQRDFKLTECKSYGSGVALRYERVRKPGKRRNRQ